MTIGYCMRCRAKKEIKNPEEVISKGKLFIKGICPKCGAKITKVMSIARPKVEIAEIPEVQPTAPKFAVGQRVYLVQDAEFGGGAMIGVLPRGADVVVVSCSESTILVEFAKGVVRGSKALFNSGGRALVGIDKIKA